MRRSFHSVHFKINNHQFTSSCNVGVNEDLGQCDLVFFLHSVKYCDCSLRAWVCWLELIIMCGSLWVYIHALLVLWQAESVCAHNERGVREALYCIILLYSTPEGSEWRKLFDFTLHHCVCVCEVSRTSAQLGEFDWSSFLGVIHRGYHFTLHSNVKTYAILFLQQY